MNQIGQSDALSEARFQECLPFEPINKGRLEILLRGERTIVRQTAGSGSDRFQQRIHTAQIAARRVLQDLTRRLDVPAVERQMRESAMASAVHAAEEQLPDSWLPFVLDTAS